MASKCTECGDTESYNFALNIGLCNPCIGERLEKLEAALNVAETFLRVHKGTKLVLKQIQALNS